MSNSLIKLPGTAEAEAIAQDYNTALNGIVAWVRVGLRMIDVKDRAGKGQFTKWVEENLVSHVIPMKRAHLFRAKAVAEYLIYENGVSRDAVLIVCEDQEHPIWQDVIGKSTRQLSLEVSDAKTSEKEDEARQSCEERWEKDAELRDEWEPRCLSGEISYVHALAGMTGADETKDSERKSEKSFTKMNAAAGSLKRHWKTYNNLSPEQRNTLITSICDALESAPDVVRRSLQRTLSKQTETPNE
jgi:hypothetical protein